MLRIDGDGRVGDLALGEVPGAIGSERQDPKSMPPILEETSVPNHPGWRDDRRCLLLHLQRRSAHHRPRSVHDRHHGTTDHV